MRSLSLPLATLRESSSRRLQLIYALYITPLFCAIAKSLRVPFAFTAAKYNTNKICLRKQHLEANTVEHIWSIKSFVYL